MNDQTEITELHRLLQTAWGIIAEKSITSPVGSDLPRKFYAFDAELRKRGIVGPNVKTL